MRKDVATNLVKIVKCLESSEDWLWIKEIGRRTGLNHKTVSRLIDTHLTMFLEMQTMEPFNMRMMKLKPDANIQGIMRFLTVKDKIKNTG